MYVRCKSGGRMKRKIEGGGKSVKFRKLLIFCCKFSWLENKI